MDGQNLFNTTYVNKCSVCGSEKIIVTLFTGGNCYVNRIQSKTSNEEYEPLFTFGSASPVMYSKQSTIIKTELEIVHTDKYGYGTFKFLGLCAKCIKKVNLEEVLTIDEL